MDHVVFSCDEMDAAMLIVTITSSTVKPGLMRMTVRKVRVGYFFFLFADRICASSMSHMPLGMALSILNWPAP